MRYAYSPMSEMCYESWHRYLAICNRAPNESPHFLRLSEIEEVVFGNAGFRKHCNELNLLFNIVVLRFYNAKE